MKIDIDMQKRRVDKIGGMREYKNVRSFTR